MVEIEENEIKKFEKHMGLAQEFKIGEDTFKFLPLRAEDIPELLKVIRVFTTKVKPGEEENWLEAMDKETIEILVKLIKKMVKISYPKLSEEQIDNFVSANFIALSVALFQINDLGAKKVGAIKERLEKLRAARRSKK